MTSQDNIIAEYRNYAREATETHAIDIKRKYGSESLAIPERLQVFNEHIDDLKTQLGDRIIDIIRDYKAPMADTENLYTKLMQIHNACINDFYKMEF